MNLREYMFRKRLTCTSLAEILDCSRQWVAHAKNGHKVSAKFARQIEKITDGNVTVDEILNPKDEEWINKNG
jgi:DNA-binding transcriptional regulator YdaS (Cro superfamily)